MIAPSQQRNPHAWGDRLHSEARPRCQTNRTPAFIHFVQHCTNIFQPALTTGRALHRTIFYTILSRGLSWSAPLIRVLLQYRDVVSNESPISNDKLSDSPIITTSLHKKWSPPQCKSGLSTVPSPIMEVTRQSKTALILERGPGVKSMTENASVMRRTII